MAGDYHKTAAFRDNADNNCIFLENKTKNKNNSHGKDMLLTVAIFVVTV